MGSAHVSDQAWESVRTANAAGKIIDHATAANLAYAYSWGWASCWFDSTGNFAFPHDFNGVKGMDPAEHMDQCLFGWWWDDHHDDNDVQARTAMGAYLEHRLATDGGVDVKGWKELQAASRGL